MLNDSKYDCFKSLFAANGLSAKPYEEKQIVSWLGDLEPEQVQAVCNSVEGNIEWFKSKAAGTKYSVISQIFPGNKDFDWTIKKYVEQSKQEAKDEEKKKEFESMGIAQLMAAVMEAQTNKNKLDSYGGKLYDEAYDRYMDLLYAFRYKLRAAFNFGDLQVVKFAADANADLVFDVLIPGTRRTKSVDWMKNELSRILMDRQQKGNDEARRKTN